jgi:hypothetical protein
MTWPVVPGDELISKYESGEVRIYAKYPETGTWHLVGHLIDSAGPTLPTTVDCVLPHPYKIPVTVCFEAARQVVHY